MTVGSELFKIADLAVEFDTYGGVVQAVRGISFSVSKGQTLAIVGESGCGKSVSVQSMMGLIPIAMVPMTVMPTLMGMMDQKLGYQQRLAQMLQIAMTLIPPFILIRI